MKLFHLYRKEDETGVSGTGPVVEGVEFTNGWCAIRWLSNQSTLCFYQSLADVRQIHSHGGKTELIVHDFAPVQGREAKKALEKPEFELFLQLVEELSKVIYQAEADGVRTVEIRATILHLHMLLDRLQERLEHRLRAA